MGLLDGIDSVLDSGAVEAAVDVGSSAGNWWDTALDWGTTAFQWMEDHPVATRVLGGVVGGAGQYLAKRELQDRESELLRKQWERERRAQMISPGKVSGYGSHVGQFGGGLLTGGPVAGYRGLREREEG
ncbi:hypothetical protein EQG41_18355 [Billgrantia azerbaijanica]|nr:hypothetical protein EQG41_18355 [Halomonas azerbaijanica]